MIAPYFVPRRRVGSLRPYKFTTHLQRFGWKPFIFTIGSTNSNFSEIERTSLEGVEIHRINPPFDRTSGSQPITEPKDTGGIVSEWSHSLADWFDRQIPMDSWILLFRGAYSKILKEARSIDPTLIWSTGDPWSGHWVGHKLSNDLNKPWIADFRDPWTLSGLSLRNRSAFSNKIDRYLEKKFIHEADKVVFTSKATERLYSDHYSLESAKTDTVYNSYNDYDLDINNAGDTTNELTINKEKLNILFFGSFRRLSPAKPIAEALAGLPSDIRNEIRIHSFGQLMDDDRQFIDARNVEYCFKTHKKVLPERAPLIFAQADVLLVSTSSERESIIPAKLWEYLTSDKPILSIAPNPEIGKILEETGAGVQIAGSKTDKISDLLQMMVKKKKEGQPLFGTERDLNAIEQYSSENTTRKLAQIMNTLAGDEQ